MTTEPDPIPEEFRKDMERLATLLDDFFNPDRATTGRKIGFFLTTFNIGAPGTFNYISNAEKLDVKTMLKDVVARIEEREKQGK